MSLDIQSPLWRIKESVCPWPLSPSSGEERRVSLPGHAESLSGEELSYFLTTTSIQHPRYYPAGGQRLGCAPSPAATRALCLQELGNKDGPTYATQ